MRTKVGIWRSDHVIETAPDNSCGNRCDGNVSDDVYSSTCPSIAAVSEKYCNNNARDYAKGIKMDRERTYAE
jgi:hypothetical protein